MGVFTVVKNGAGNVMKRAANGAGNLVAKASTLSSLQLEEIENRREQYLTEMPDTEPDVHIKRLLGSYAIEAYEAYLSEIQTLYKPISLGEQDDTDNLNDRIRYFEITKWVTDPTENNLDKLKNLYRVVSEESCNIALIYDRKRTGCKIYFAVVNTRKESIPSIANSLRDRLASALQGNFPGAVTHEGGVGIPKPLQDLGDTSLAIVSNIPSEKSEKFATQSIEKLLDGIVPQNEDEEYTIVLLATPSQASLERKTQLAELYSELLPFAEWSMQHGTMESSMQSSSATSGLNLGMTFGRQTGVTNTTGTSSSETQSTSTTDGETNTQGETRGESTTEQESQTDTDTTSQAHMTGTQESTSQQTSSGETSTHQESSTTTDGTTSTEGKNIQGGASVSVKLGPVDLGVNASTGKFTSESTSHSFSSTVSDSVAKVVSESLSKTLGTSVSDTESISKAVSKAVSTALTKSYSTTDSIAKTLSKTAGVADTLGKMASSASSVAHNLGGNIGANFARSSTVSVNVGKNETLTQNFSNHSIKDTLEVIQKQMKRMDESNALGLWDFSAYFLSRSQTVANNAAHMYLSLTQGEDSYLTQTSINFWENRAGTQSEHEIEDMLTFLKRLQHPEFVLDPMEENWLMYPPHIDATVTLTGKELAYAMNMPKKSVSGLPVLETASFGREVQRYSYDAASDNYVTIGKSFHMLKTENTPVRLDMQSLCSHTFVTGSTGVGKSTMIYTILADLMDDDIRFLVIEPAKGEYKDVFGGYQGVSVYGTNPLFTELLRINPFSFPRHISVLEHIDRLVEIFNACWPMYAAMPAVLKDAIEQIYRDKGWMFANPSYYSTDFPTFADLLQVLPQIMDSSLYSADTKSDYAGALMTRVKSLTNGINGTIFCSDAEIDAKALFDENVIVDISRVGSSETKSLIMGILMMKLQEYRMQPQASNHALRHVTVLEEAHNLLRKTSLAQAQEGANLQGKSVEMLTNAIAEMRTYGEGFIIADQAPDLLDAAVIRNTNTKIVFRLPDTADCELIGKSMALKPEQIREIAKLPSYVAAVYQNDWVEAVLCKSEPFSNPKPYAYEPIDYNMPIRVFLSSLFSTSEKLELQAEETKIVENWIKRLDNSDYTKSLLHLALHGDALSEQQKRVIAYNVFSGQMLVESLRNAVKPEDGVDAVRQRITQTFQFEDDSQAVTEIQRCVLDAIMRVQQCQDLAIRYQHFGNGGIR